MASNRISVNLTGGGQQSPTLDDVRRAHGLPGILGLGASSQRVDACHVLPAVARVLLCVGQGEHVHVVCPSAEQAHILFGRMACLLGGHPDVRVWHGTVCLRSPRGKVTFGGRRDDRVADRVWEVVYPAAPARPRARARMLVTGRREAQVCASDSERRVL